MKKFLLSIYVDSSFYPPPKESTGAYYIKADIYPTGKSYEISEIFGLGNISKSTYAEYRLLFLH